MADGWIYRYDFDNGDCYVGKEGSFDPFIRAAEHLQDALAVAYPEKYTGFKMLFRSTEAKYVTINRYSRAKIQKLGWQWGLQGRYNDEGIKFTRQEIEKARKDSTGPGVSHIYWTVEGKGNNRKDILEKEKEKLEDRISIDFKNALKEIYNNNDIGQYRNLPDPTGDYNELLQRVKSWKYISVKEIRQLFQVTSTEIAALANSIKKNNDAGIKKAGINLTSVLNVIFGKADNIGQRSKTNDWINIFYTEVRKSSEIKGRKAGASLLDVCEMFATLNAYYELGTSKITNSEGDSPEMLNNEILMTNFSSLATGQQQSIGRVITESIDLQEALGEKGNIQLLKNIIEKLGSEGNKAGAKVKILYELGSSQIANLIAKRIRTTNIWGNKGEKQKEEMFKKVFALLTNGAFSRIGNKEQDNYIPLE